MDQNKPQTIFLADYKPTPYLVSHVDLDVSLAPEDTQVTATYSLSANPASSEAKAALRLDGENIKLISISLDGRTLAPADYHLDAESLTIPSVPQHPFKLSIETRCNPEANKALSGLYLSNGIFCTQCEAEGFRRIAYAYDRPDVMSTYTVRLEADKHSCPVLLSNGNPGETGDIADTARHFAVWHDPHPKPTYLFAMVAGKLGSVHDTFTTASGRKVQLGIYVEKGKESLCGFAMQALKDSMSWDERRFNREYDLDVFNIVAVSDFNMGAMENKGLNVFNDKYILAVPETATDQDFINVEAIIAHEYFHNWTGNRITCRDWFQLCLKEGLTVFRDQEFTSDMRSRPVKRIADVQTLRARQLPEDAGPLAHPPRPSSYIEINNFYTPTVYEKGAEICRMLMTLVGKDGFRSALDLYFARHDGEAATVEQFVRCFEDSSGRDLSQFFTWYEQAGTPVVSVATDYDAATKTFTITLSQSTAPTPGQTEKRPLHIPLRFGLVGQNGEDLDVGVDLLELREAEQHFRFEGIGQKPILSISRGFSAPVILKATQSSDERLFLLAHDSDSFNRWEAVQTEALALLMATVKAMESDSALPNLAQFSQALASAASDEKLDQAFKAQLLTLPTEAAISGAIGKDIDTDIVFAARQHMRAHVGNRLSNVLGKLWDETREKHGYKLKPEDTGRRALRYAVLSLIAAGDPAEGAKLAEHEFATSVNMTAEIGSLAAMLSCEQDVMARGLARFYDRHAENPLLIDKWLGLSAAVTGPDSAARVRALTTHKAFSFTTPNRVYALLGGFASGNPSGFHAADGSGYELMADMVLKLDPLNPQVAARMAGTFRSWQQMNEVRKQHARKALQRILAEADLSRDCYEIVSKTAIERR